MLTVVLLVFASYKTKAHVVNSTIASNTNSVQQGHIKLITLVYNVFPMRAAHPSERRSAKHTKKGPFLALLSQELPNRIL
jgi:hypothetical protein